MATSTGRGCLWLAHARSSGTSRRQWIGARVHERARARTSGTVVSCARITVHARAAGMHRVPGPCETAGPLCPSLPSQVPPTACAKNSRRHPQCTACDRRHTRAQVGGTHAPRILENALAFGEDILPQIFGKCQPFHAHELVRFHDFMHLVEGAARRARAWRTPWVDAKVGSTGSSGTRQRDGRGTTGRPWSWLLSARARARGVGGCGLTRRRVSLTQRDGCPRRCRGRSRVRACGTWRGRRGP